MLELQIVSRRRYLQLLALSYTLFVHGQSRVYSAEPTLQPENSSEPTQFGVHAQSTVPNNGGPYPQFASKIQGIFGNDAIVRDWWDWFVIQPLSSDKYDWSLPDAAVNAAKSMDQKLIVCLFGTPKWASGGKGIKWPATNTQDWKNFVTSVVRRYKDKGVVVAWEIWNEENTPTFFEDGSTDSWQVKADTYYKKVMLPAYDAAKAVDPNTPIALGGIAPAWDGKRELAAFGFLNQVLSNKDAPSHMDYVCYHSYLKNPADILEAIRQIRQVMSKYGIGSKPIVVTEWSGPARGTNEELQSNLFMQSAVMLQVANVLYACLHYVIDISGEQYGLFRQDGSRFQLADAYQIYLQQMSGSVYVGDCKWISKGSGSYGYLFTRANGQVIPVWNTSGKDTVAIQIASKFNNVKAVKRRDTTTQTTVLKISPANRSVTLSVDQNPTFLVITP